MKSNQILQDFYDVCEICGDDFNLVAELIHFHNSKDERLSRILTDITEYHDMKRIERYAKTFDHILSLPSSYIKVFVEIKKGRISSQIIKIDRSKLPEEFKANSRVKEWHYKPPRGCMGKVNKKGEMCSGRTAPPSIYCANPLFEEYQ